jgi:hypothetical protein
MIIDFRVTAPVKEWMDPGEAKQGGQKPMRKVI